MGGSLLLRSCNTCDRTTRLIARTVSQEPTEALPPTEMAFTRLATPSAPARQVNQIRARRCIQPACHQRHSTYQGHSRSHPLCDREGAQRGRGSGRSWERYRARHRAGLIIRGGGSQEDEGLPEAPADPRGSPLNRRRLCICRAPGLATVRQPPLVDAVEVTIELGGAKNPVGPRCP